MTVASSPSPKPSCAGPLAHDASLNELLRHAAPGLLVESQYFQTAPVATSVVVNGATESTKLLLANAPAASVAITVMTAAPDCRGAGVATSKRSDPPPLKEMLFVGMSVGFDEIVVRLIADSAVSRSDTANRTG